MGTKARPLPQHIGHVVIPGKLLTKLRDFLGSLYNPIMKEAAEHAFDRKSGPSAGLINADDLIQAAQRVFATSLAEVSKTLKSSETRNDRKKAS